MQTIKIFLSSPSDVANERGRAEQVINELNAEFAGETVVELYRWEESFYSAADTFQAQIMSPAKADIVICIFWKRLGSTLPDAFNREDGTARTGSEYEFETALQAARDTDPRCPDIFVYRKTEKVFYSEDRVEQERQEKKLLDEFWTKWFRNEQGHFTSSFKTFLTSDEFVDTLEMDLRAWLRRRAGDVDWDTATRGSPYRGLEAFGEEHASMFFGRRREVDRARAKLIEAATKGFPFLFIVGSSGSGKSSLMRAGLVPRLMAPESTPQINRFVRVITSPASWGVDLFDRLARQIIAGAAQSGLAFESSTNATSLGSALREHPDQAAATIIQALDGWARTIQMQDRRQYAPHTGLLICLDQFEEIFARSSQARAEFARTMRTLASTGRIWCVATMRSDFFEQLLLDPELRGLKDSGATLEISPPSSADIRDIIFRPASAARVTFEVSADGRRDLLALIEADAAEPGALPMIQFLLDRLFDLRNTASSMMTLAAYDQLGGAAGALAAHGDELIASVQPAAQETFPSLVRALVKVDIASGKPTARTAALAHFPADSPIRELVDKLAEGRLLTISAESADSAESGERQANVRLAHEALLERWGRLRAEVGRNARDLQTRERLDQAFQLWEESTGKNKERRLLRDLELEEGIDLEQRWKDQLPQPLRDYIATSQRRDAINRRGQTVRWTAGLVLGVVALATGALAWITFDSSNKVAAQRDDARFYQSRMLSQQARQLIDGDRPDLSKASLLAVESLADPVVCQFDHRTPRCGAQLSVLRAALSRLLPAEVPAQPIKEYESASTVVGVSMSHDQTRMAVSQWDNEVIIRQVADGAKLRSLRIAGCAAEGDAAAAPNCIPSLTTFFNDDRRLLVSYQDGSLRTWDTSDGRELGSWPVAEGGGQNSPTRLDLSEDETKALIVLSGSVRLQSLQPQAASDYLTYARDACWISNTEVLSITSYSWRVINVVSRDTVRSVDVSNRNANKLVCNLFGGTALAIGESFMYRFSQDSLNLWSTSTRAAFPVRRAMASPNQRWIALTSSDASMVEIFDLRTDRTVGAFDSGSDINYGVALPSDTEVITGGRNRRLVRWSLRQALEGNEESVRFRQSLPYSAQLVALGRTALMNDEESLGSLDLQSDAPQKTQSMRALLCGDPETTCRVQSVLAPFESVTALVAGGRNAAADPLAQRGAARPSSIRKLAEVDVRTLEGIRSVPLPDDVSTNILARGGDTVFLGDNNVATPLSLSGARINNSAIILQGSIWGSSVSRRGDVAAFGDDAGHVRVWSAQSGAGAAWKAGEDAISRIAVSNENQWVATADSAGFVRLWTASGAQLGEYSLGGPLGQLVFTGDSSHLIGLSDNGDAYRWRVERGPRADAPPSFRLDGRAYGATYIDPASGRIYARNEQAITPITWRAAIDMPPQVEIALAQVTAQRQLTTAERREALLSPTISGRSWPDNVDPCESLVAGRDDPDRHAPAIYSTDLNIDVAKRACESAAKDNPRDGRFAAALGAIALTEGFNANSASGEARDLPTLRTHFTEAFTASSKGRQLGYRYATRQVAEIHLMAEMTEFNPTLGIQLEEEAWRAGIDRASADLVIFYRSGNLLDLDHIRQGFTPDDDKARLWMDRGALALQSGALDFVQSCWLRSIDPPWRPRPDDATGVGCRAFADQRFTTKMRLARALYNVDLEVLSMQYIDYPIQYINYSLDIRARVAQRLPQVLAACIHVRADETARRHFDLPVNILPATREFCTRTLNAEHIDLEVGSPRVEEARRNMGR